LRTGDKGYQEYREDEPVSSEGIGSGGMVGMGMGAGVGGGMGGVAAGDVDMQGGGGHADAEVRASSSVLFFSVRCAPAHTICVGSMILQDHEPVPYSIPASGIAVSVGDDRPVGLPEASHSILAWLLYCLSARFPSRVYACTKLPSRPQVACCVGSK
jgi:hypothetical protein